jgi:outer membrane lipoprotein-sorting protein
MRSLPIQVLLAMGVCAAATLAAEGVGEDQGEARRPSVAEVVEKANRVAYYQGADGKADVKMTIRDKDGKERTREFTILRWDQPGAKQEPAKDKTGKRPAGEPGKEAARVDDTHCGDQKFYVYFTKPADVSKMVFMVWKHVGRDDDRWLYAPALDLVNRIAASDERTSFVGSDFFYEDVSGRGIDEDRHELVETTKHYYVLKSTPKDPKKVEFAHYKMFIHKSSFVMVKSEYFDEKGKKYREYQAMKVKKVQGYPTVVKSVMRDLRTGSQTTLEYSDVKYNVGVPETVFTERYLKRKPRKYLR